MNVCFLAFVFFSNWVLVHHPHMSALNWTECQDWFGKPTILNRKYVWFRFSDNRRTVLHKSAKGNQQKNWTFKKPQKKQAARKMLWTQWPKPDEPQPRSQKCPVSLDEPVTTAESCFIHLCVFLNVTIEIRQKPFFPQINSTSLLDTSSVLPALKKPKIKLWALAISLCFSWTLQGPDAFQINGRSCESPDSSVHAKSSHDTLLYIPKHRLGDTKSDLAGRSVRKAATVKA